MKIQPRCLDFKTPANKGAAYTSDGYMLPCCWLDDPLVYSHMVECGMRDTSLLVSENTMLENIFVSDQWENFFTTILHDPKNAPFMCRKKCGVDVDHAVLRIEEQALMKAQLNG